MIRYIDHDYAVAPQLAPEHMAQAAKVGFRTIINNRPDFEDPHQPTAEEMERAAREAGLHYVHVPVGGHVSTEVSVETLRQALEDAPRPVLAFCRSGNRSQIIYLATKSGPR